MSLRTCRKCKIEQAIDCFVIARKNRDGISHFCRKCGQAWRIANRERILARHRKYYIDHRERCLEQASQWHKNNPEAAKQIKQRYRNKDPVKKRAMATAQVNAWTAKNRERARATCRRFKTNNRAKATAAQNLREARKRQRTPSWVDKQAIDAIYEHCAQKSRDTGILHEVDHYYPLMGKLVSGLHVSQNLRVVPAELNRRKRNYHPEEFAEG